MTERHAAANHATSSQFTGNAFAQDALPVIVEQSSLRTRCLGVWRPALALVLLLIVTTGALFHITSNLQRPILGPVPDEATMGAVLAAGGLFHANADRLDQRALIASRIHHLRQTPDVAVIADRSWQLLQQDLRWQRSVFGAYIDRLMPSDIRQILTGFSDAGHMPGTIILALSPDYLTRKDRILTLASVDASMGTEAAESVLLQEQQSAEPKHYRADRPVPGITPYHATLDTIYPDGSVIWSTKRTRELSNRHLEADALHVVNRLRQ